MTPPARSTSPRVRWAALAGRGLLLALGAVWTAGRENEGDLRVYYDVVARLPRGLDLYQQLEATPAGAVTAYIYPPPFAVAFLPFTWLPFPVARGAWFFLMGACALRAGLLAYALLRREGPPPSPAWRQALALCLGLSVALRFAWSDLGHGQVNLLVAWLTLEGLGQAARGRDAPAGALIAAATLIKLTPAILIAGYLLERRWRLVAWACGAGVVGLALPSLALGVRGNLDALARFVTVVTPWNATAHAYTANNVALGGLLQRLLVGVGPPGQPPTPLALAWEPAAAHLVSTLASCALLAASLLLGRRLRPVRRDALLLAAIPLISPVAWKPHLVCLILPALLAGEDLARGGLRRAWPLLAGLTLLGAGGRFPLGRDLSGSLTLWGGTALGVALLAAGLCRRPAEADPADA